MAAEFLRTVSFLRRRKGVGMSVKTVGKIVLGMLTVTLIYMAMSGWFTEIGSSFVDSIYLPEP